MLAKISSAIVICVLLTNAICLAQSTELTKEDILALIKEFDDALRDHDTDRILSLLTNDAINDMVVIPPYGNDGARQFFDEMWPVYPTLRDHPDVFALASAA